MTRPRTTSRARARLVAGALGAALTAGLVAAPGAAPRAAAAPGDSPRLASLQERASALRASVDALRVRADLAVEDFVGAREDLAGAVTAHQGARQALDRRRAAADADRRSAGARVSALYRAGGGLALYAPLLDGLLGGPPGRPGDPDLHGAVLRARAVDAVVAEDHARAETAAVASAGAARAEARLRTAARERTRAERRVAAAAARYTDLLARETRLLAAVDGEVRRLAEAEREARRRAAEEAFRARLAAAQAARLAARLAAERATAEAARLAAPTRSEGGPAAWATGPGVPASRTPWGRGAAGAAYPGAVDLPAPRGAAVAVALAAARAQLGKPYLWGATGPDAFDCSGLTGWAYAAAGLRLPRTSRQQWYAGARVGLADLAPGDLLFWADDVGDPSTIHHVALYAGDGMMVAAPRAGTLVRVQPVYLDGYIGAVRPTA